MGFYLWVLCLLVCLEGCVSHVMRHPLPLVIHELVVVGARRGITWHIGSSQVRRRLPRHTWWAHGMRWEHRGARIYWVWDRGRPFSWLVHKTYLRGHLGPDKPWEALLLLLGGDIELNPGPSSGLWAAVYTAQNKGLVKFEVVKKHITQKVHEVANKRLYTMQHAALRKDGVFFRLTKNWTRGPLKPAQKQPSPDLARALLANFTGNPPYDMPAIEALIPQLIPRGHMTDDPPSFDEFKRACMGKCKKAVGPDGVPHRLLGMLPDDTRHTLYQGLLEVWRRGDIPRHWLRSKVVLMYKKVLLLARNQVAMTSGGHPSILGAPRLIGTDRSPS